MRHRPHATVALALLAPLAAACASTPAHTESPPAESTEPSSDAGTVSDAASASDGATTSDASTVAASPPPPAVDPCVAGPVFEAIAAIPPGHTLADPRVGGYPLPTEHAAPLEPLFPEVQRQGYQVLSVAPADVIAGDARELVALLTPTTSTVERDRPVREPHLGVLTCRPNAGWVLAARPYHLGSSGLEQILRVEPTDLPGGAKGATVTVFSYYETGESNATPFLLGTATPALPVYEPRGEAVGVLAALGTVGERVATEGGGYRRIVPLDATGWYPLGDGQAFVRARRETYDESGHMVDGVLLDTLASLDARGLHVQDFEGPSVWLMVGAGEPPAWCAGATAGARCGRLTYNGEALSDGTIPYAWIAGAWPIDAPPRAADFPAPGARWFHAGSWSGDRPPRDPSGHAPVTGISVRPPRAAGGARRGR